MRHTALRSSSTNARRVLALLVYALALSGSSVQAADTPASLPATRPSKLDAYVASLKAKGEPTTPADILSPPVPDKDNAVWYLKRAADTIVPEHSGPRNSSQEYGPALPYGTQWDQQADEMMQAHPRLFELAREARKHPKVDWGIRFEVVNGVNAPVLPSLSPHRALQNMLADAILYHHFHGDDAAALETTQDALFAADAIGECPLLIGHLMASIRRQFADQCIQIIATGLTILNAAHPSNLATAHPAKREEVEKLIQILLDDEHLRQQCRKAFESERMVTLSNAQSRQAAAPSMDQKTFFVNYFDVMDEAIESSRRPGLTPMKVQEGPDPTHLVEQIAPTRRILFEIILSHRMAAVGLATRLYCNDTGHYPATLAELVPAYLPTVPADPLTKQDRPLGYRLANGGKRPILWSVGPNGVAEKWDQTAIPKLPSYSPKSLQGNGVDDQWVDLSAWH